MSEAISEYSKRCRENIREGYKHCLDMLKKQQQLLQVEDDVMKQEQADVNFLRIKESSYENLGFSDNMTYEQRSELRKECSKFLRFSYLVDFLAMESLQTIYKLSVNEMVKEIHTMVNYKDVFAIKDKTSRPITKQRDPMFFC